MMSEDEAEFEFTGEDETNKKEPNSNNNQQDNDGANNCDLVDHSTSTSTTPPTNSTNTIICPLCQEDIPIEHQDADGDSILAQHMNSCQTRRSTRRGRNNINTNQETTKSVPTATTTTTSQYGRNVKRPNYAEHDILLLDQNSDNDDESVVVWNDDDHDDEGGGDLLDSQMDDSDIEIITGQAPSKQSRSSHLDNTASSPPSAVDDWDEDDYEDRVDDWIENGLSRMRVMKEQDEAETPPGKVSCDLF